MVASTHELTFALCAFENSGEVWLPDLYDLRTFRFEFPILFRKERAHSLG